MPKMFSFAIYKSRLRKPEFLVPGEDCNYLLSHEGTF